MVRAYQALGFRLSASGGGRLAGSKPAARGRRASVQHGDAEGARVVVQIVIVDAQVQTPGRAHADPLATFTDEEVVVRLAHTADERGGRTVVSLGSLVAEQVVQVVLRLNFPLGEIGRETGVVLSVAGEEDATESLSWEYADGRTNDTQERNAEVDRAVATVFAARARQEATALNRAGNYPAAQAALTSVAKRIRSYAGRDSLMRALVTELENDAFQLAAPMPEINRKQMYAQSAYAARSRNAATE